jgi:uncharacterized protein YmfQ (DUF2313 family)
VGTVERSIYSGTVCAVHCCVSELDLVRMWADILIDCMLGRLTGTFTVVQFCAVQC